MFECTKEALDKMKAKLADMEGRQRTELLELVAQSQSDETNSDENSGFRDAHQQFHRLEMDIAVLRERIDSAVIAETTSADVVRVGSQVQLDMAGDTWHVFVGHIVESSDHDIVSPSSPLGQALLGAAPGATITWRAPSGALSAQVKEIS